MAIEWSGDTSAVDGEFWSDLCPASVSAEPGQPFGPKVCDICADSGRVREVLFEDTLPGVRIGKNA